MAATAQTQDKTELGWLLAVGTQVSTAYHARGQGGRKGEGSAVSRSWKAFPEREFFLTTPRLGKATPCFIFFLPRGSCMISDSYLNLPIPKVGVMIVPEVLRPVGVLVC